MAAQDNLALAHLLIDLYNSHQSDPEWSEKAGATFAADSTFTNVPLGGTLPGAEGWKQYTMFFAEAFPGSQVELANIFATDDQVVIEFTGRGTNTGTLHTPMGDIPATGKSAELRHCNILQTKNGKIVSSRAYYDTMTLLQQLGLLPPMG